MSSSSIFVILAIVVYLVGMILIGYRHSKGTNTSSDFYLGGRKLGPFVAAMSTEASDMSAYLLMGVPGLALFCGVAEAGWTAIGLAAGTYLNWLFVARRLRIYSARLDAITVPDFLAKRFRDNTKLIEIIGSLVIIVFFVPYTASGFVACGKLFNTMFGWDYVPTMIISAIVIVAYCTMGGFMARPWLSELHRQHEHPRRRPRQIRIPRDLLHSVLGLRLLWHAPHPDPLHGSQR